MVSERVVLKYGWVMFFCGIFVGVTLAIVVAATTVHRPDINCNNSSANDGPTYSERDITDYEWDVYCE